MFGEFLAQRVAVDAQHLRRQRLVAAGLGEDDFEHRPFDALQDHVIDRGGFFAVEVTEILLQRIRDMFPQVLLAHAANASSLSYFRCSSSSASRKKKSFTACIC
jgi:hypothetical protein